MPSRNTESHIDASSYLLLTNWPHTERLSFTHESGGKFWFRLKRNQSEEGFELTSGEHQAGYVSRHRVRVLLVEDIPGRQKELALQG